MKLNTRPSTGQISATFQTDTGQATIPLGTKSKTEARSLIKEFNLNDVESLAKAGELTASLVHKLVTGGKRTLAQAIEEWTEYLQTAVESDRTAICHKSHVTKWAREHHLNKHSLLDITPRHISDFINGKDGTKLGTRRARLAAIRSLFKLHAIRGNLTRDPSREVTIKKHLLSHDQKEPGQKKVFTDEELAKITTHLTELMVELAGSKAPGAKEKLDTAKFWYCATLIGRYSGLRLGDICSLEWSTMKEPGFLTVWTDKRNTRVSLPISEALQFALDAIPAPTHKSKSPYCFPEQAAAHQDASKRSKHSVQFLRLLEACDIKGHSFHDLRATLATELNADGESLEAIAKALGHTSTETTKGYIHEPAKSDRAGHLPR